VLRLLYVFRHTVKSVIDKSDRFKGVYGSIDQLLQSGQKRSTISITVKQKN
jgi:hypothetical protein